MAFLEKPFSCRLVPPGDVSGELDTGLLRDPPLWVGPIWEAGVEGPVLGRDRLGLQPVGRSGVEPGTVVSAVACGVATAVAPAGARAVL